MPVVVIGFAGDHELATEAHERTLFFRRKLGCFGGRSGLRADRQERGKKESSKGELHAEMVKDGARGKEEI
jgi:hypothetical protein